MDKAYQRILSQRFLQGIGRGSQGKIVLVKYVVYKLVTLPILSHANPLYSGNGTELL